MQHRETAGAADGARRVPAAVIARLPELLAILDEASRQGTHTLSSDELALSIDVSGAMVRKDLSFLGFSGTRGIGFDVAALRYQIAQVLDLNADRPVALVGCGHLGRALVAYPGFAAQGFRIAAAFDCDPSIIGSRVGGCEELPVHDVSLLETVIATAGIRMAILAVPATSAQAISDRLVAAGVVGLLNFAPVSLVVPPAVRVRRTDLAAELQILAFHARHPGTAASVMA